MRGRPDNLAKKVSQEIKDEFGMRLRQAIANGASLPEPVRENLVQIAEVFGIAINLEDEKIVESKA